MRIEPNNQTQFLDLTSLTLYDIWQGHWPNIANQNAWACMAKGCSVANRNSCFSNCENTEHRAQACTTAKNYAEYVRQLYGYLPLPLCKITPQDLALALAAVQSNGGKKGSPYSESTMGLFVSAVKAVLRYAAPDSSLLAFFNGKALPQSNSGSNRKKHSHSYPKASHYKVKGIKGTTEVKKLSKDFLVRFKRYAQKKTFADMMAERRALTLSQDEKFIRLIMADLYTDSRAIGLAIIRYTGVRPAELSYLKWRHFKFFSDGSGRMYLLIKNTADRNGTPKDRTKSKNSVRPIPICGELQVLIDAYCQYLKKLSAERISATSPFVEEGTRSPNLVNTMSS